MCAVANIWYDAPGLIEWFGSLDAAATAHDGIRAREGQ